MTDLSIIIVSYNTKQDLSNCLTSIFTHTKIIKFEVIVVDNDSKDGSPGMVKKDFPQVKLIPAGDNLGFGRANNLGASQAKGKYLLFLNPDTAVSKGTIPYVLDYLKKHYKSYSMEDLKAKIKELQKKLQDDTLTELDKESVKQEIKELNNEYIEWAKNLEDKEKREEILSKVQGVLVPGGFGERGAEGKIKAVRYARENKIPFLGLCLGMQTAVIEFARHVCGLKNANSTEFNKGTRHPVISLLEEQKKISDKGATMRLGAYECRLKKDTIAYKAYKKEKNYEICFLWRKRYN